MGLRDRFKKIFGQGAKEDEKTVRENESSDKILFRGGEIVSSSIGNVLFVCRGNVDRSPMAEAIFNRKATGQKAFSAGLFAHNGGEASYNTVIACANHGIDISDHKTRNIKDFPVEDMDLILAVNVPVRETLKNKYPNLKIFTIKEYAGDYSDLDIRDPSGGDLSDYEECFGEIDEAISKILGLDAEIIDKPISIDDEEPVGNIVDEDEVDGGSAKNKVRNFKYLDDLIHSGVSEIVLDSDIILEEGEKDEYVNSGITVDVDELIIDGRGHTIDAKQKTPIFFISGNVNVTIKNINLINGLSDGGAIYVSGKLTIQESQFVNNRTCVEYEYGGGGAIYNGGELIITKSIFKNNSTNAEGGAIYNIGELITTKSTFNGNSSNGSGGAIMSTGILMMYGCEILHNTSPYEIIITNKYSEIYNTIFKGNNAPIIIDNHGSKATFGVFYSKFIENEVQSAVISNNGRYGVINSITFQGNLLNDDSRNIINRNELTLIGTNVSEEKSILNEGYLLIKESSQNSEDIIEGEGEFVIYENMIPEEDRFDFGHLDKIIHKSTSKEIVLDHDITFENYEREFYEGGVELDIDNLIIDGNGKTIDAKGKSRIFIITGSNITLKNIVFKNGYFYENILYPLKVGGGALKTIQNSNLKIENCNFINNASEDVCGVIDNSGEVTVIDSIFADNWAKDCAGVIYNRGKMDIIGSSFQNNGADNRGGVAYNEGELTLLESACAENKSKRNGGVVYNRGVLNVKESELINNSANKKGGGIYNKNKLVMSNAVFQGNTSGYDGAGLYNKGESVISEMAFESNTSGYDGGALFNIGELTVSALVVESNTSGNEGGGLFNAGKSNINAAKFIKNESEVGGGALSNSGELSIEGVDFIQNASKMVGGAISSHGIDLNIMESNFNENNAGKMGGAIFSFMGKLDIIKSKFNGNGTHEDGGAIYNEEAELFLKETIFIENSSIETAGAIFNKDGEVNMHDSTIKGNMARVGGGAIVNTADLIMSKSSLMNNETRGIGGAIVNTANMEISESEISHNSAIHMAGAIDNYNGHVTISESVFKANEVKWDGGVEVSESVFEGGEWNGSGVLYNDDGKLSVFDSTFADNIIRGRESKAIWSNNSDCEVIGCNFENNHLEEIEFDDAPVEDVGCEDGDIEFDDVSVEEISSEDGDIEFDDVSVEEISSEDGDIEFDDGPVGSDDVSVEDGNDSSEDRGFEDENDMAIDEFKELTEDDSPNCFKYLDNLIHSGVKEIVLDFDIILSNSEESKYLNGILLDVDGLIIDGKGYTVDAHGKSRIFHCTGKNVSIKNIVLTNGFADQGGAILNNGELTISGSTLNENTAQEYGGAICSEEGELTIVESKFENNSAGYGGAISNSDVSDIERTVINQNTAGSGGGILNNGKMTIKDSRLQRNRAENSYGGAIDNTDELTIIDCEITGNFAECDGGAIHNNCADLSLIGSSFSGNRANERGDAIFNYRENSFKVQNCDLDFWDIVKYNEYDGD